MKGYNGGLVRSITQKNGAAPKGLSRAQPVATPRGTEAFETFSPEQLEPKRGLSGVERYWAARGGPLAVEFLASRGLGCGCAGRQGVGDVASVQAELADVLNAISLAQTRGDYHEVSRLKSIADELSDQLAIERDTAAVEEILARQRAASEAEEVAIARDTAAVEEILAKQRASREAEDPYRQRTISVGEAPSYSVVGLPPGVWKVERKDQVGAGFNVLLQEVEEGWFSDDEVAGSAVLRWWPWADAPTLGQKIKGTAKPSAAPNGAIPSAAPSKPVVDTATGVVQTLFGPGPAVPKALQATQDVYGALFGAPPPVVAPPREKKGLSTGAVVGIGLATVAVVGGLVYAASRGGGGEPERKQNRPRRRWRTWR